MVLLRQFLLLQFLPLILVWGGEAPLVAQPVHAHTVCYQLKASY